MIAGGEWPRFRTSEARASLGVNGQAPVKTWTVYDGQQVYADFDGAGTLKTRYLNGPAVDELLARMDSGGGNSWYLTDRLGTVRDRVDASTGNVTNHIKYTSFGEVTYQSNSGDTDRFKYTGRDYDMQTKLSYHRARYLDTPSGRWTSEDPIGFAAGDFNLYRYVGNSATNYVDPSGLQERGGPGRHPVAAHPTPLDDSLRAPDPSTLSEPDRQFLTTLGDKLREILGRDSVRSAFEEFVAGLKSGDSTDWDEADLLAYFMVSQGEEVATALFYNMQANGYELGVSPNASPDNTAKQDPNSEGPGRIWVFQQWTAFQIPTFLWGPLNLGTWGVKLRDAASALYGRLQHDLGDKAFSRQMFEALNLSGKQMAFILAHPELFDEAIVATIREAQRKQNAYINSMSNATDQIVYDQVGGTLMAGGLWAAGKFVKYAGGLMQRYRTARRAKQLDKAAKATAGLESRAKEVHGVLLEQDPSGIAHRQRTTAVLRTDKGDIISGGKRDLSPAQRKALKPGEIPSKLVGEDAEITALTEAKRRGAKLRAIATTRDFCPACRKALEESGAIISGPRTAYWPEK
jgi:RHS repeat-associated protein